MQVKEGSQHYRVEEYGVGDMTDISPHDKCTDEENGPSQVKEETQHVYPKEHASHHVTDISINERIDKGTTVDVGELCSANTTESRYKTHTYIHKRVLSERSVSSVIYVHVVQQRLEL